MTRELWCTVPGCHHPQLEFVTCCVREWEGEATDCAVNQPHLGLTVAGQERKKKTICLDFKLTTTSQRVNLKSPRGCSCMSVGATQAFLWVWSLICGLSAQWICFMVSFLPALSPSVQQGQARQKQEHQCEVHAHRGAEGRCTCERVFLIKIIERLGMEFQGKCSTHPLLSHWRK